VSATQPRHISTVATDAPARHGNTRQIIITGFHRSGTSLTTQALYNANLALGDQLVAPSPSNPDGHFEDQEIVRLHDDVLQAQNRNWYSTGLPTAPNQATFHNRAVQIIDRYQQNAAGTHAIWGFKDPRTCLFLDWWSQLLPDAVGVFIYRDFWSCFLSLRHRQAQQLTQNPHFHQHSTFFWSDPLLPLRLWLDYNRAILAYAQKKPDTSLVVSHQAMVSGFELVRECNDRFDMQLAIDQPTGIKRGLRVDPITLALHNSVPDELYQDLLQTQDALNTIAVAPQLDTLQAVPVERREKNKSFISQLQHYTKELGIPNVQVASTNTPNTENDNCSLPNGIKSLLAQLGTLSKVADNSRLDELIRSIDKHHPDDVALLINTGKALRLAGRIDEAEQRLLMARRLAPKNLQVILHLALVARSRGHLRQATSLLLAAHALKPEHDGITAQIVHLLRQLKQHTKADQLVVKALNQWPDSRPLLEQRIHILLETARATEAIECCRTMLALHPDDIRTHSALASAQLMVGDIQTSMATQLQATLLRLRSTPDYCQRICESVESIGCMSERLSLQKNDCHCKIEFYMNCGS